MPDTIKIELTWKISKIVTHPRPPLQCRRYSQTTAINSQHPSPSGQNPQAIVALRSLQFRYLPQCVVRVWDLTSLAVVLSSMVVDNDYQRNCDDLKTTKDGLARHGNVKEMTVAVSNEIWTESQRIVLLSQNFQHAENLPMDATDNFGRLRWLPDSSATIDGNTRWLAGISIAIRSLTYLAVPPVYHSVSQA